MTRSSATLLLLLRVLCLSSAMVWRPAQSPRQLRTKLIFRSSARVDNLSRYASSRYAMSRCSTVRMVSQVKHLDELLQAPSSVFEALRARGIVGASPIQEAAIAKATAGESIVLHSQTGSGKTLAMLLPAMHRAAQAGSGSKLLILTPTRELAVQLADEAAALITAGILPSADESAVQIVAPGHSATHAKLLDARIIVATPPELCTLLAPPLNADSPTEQKAAALALAERLANDVSTLILDEVDALVPGRKAFRGARHWKWMDAGMHPTEAIVKFFARRAGARGFQVLAASATLDQSTRRKVSAQLRPAKLSLALISATDAGSPRVVVKRRKGSAEQLDTAGDGDRDNDGGAGGDNNGDADADVGLERWTAVPAAIDHRVQPVVDLSTKTAAQLLVKLHREMHTPQHTGGDGVADAAQTGEQATEQERQADVAEIDGDASEMSETTPSGASLVFVSSLNTRLGGVHSVARELQASGLECIVLSDALWPHTRRSFNRRGRGRGGQRKRTPAQPASEADVRTRRADLNALLASSGDGRLIIADAAATRGLHFDGVVRVYVLGLPANLDTYLHLAGRVGRLPKLAGAADATVITMASEQELQTLRGWAKGLGIKLSPAIG